MGHGRALDHERCYRAVASRDARFDGTFYTAVRTTGIYCRPSCPATTPKPANVTFYRTAAAAQREGYRACRRCRPDATPGSPEWNIRGDVVARVMRLVADGVVERNGVAGLATGLGYSERHLNRLVTEELGAGILAIARTQRAHTARILLETTDMARGGGLGGWLRQHPLVQRHGRRGLRHDPDRPAGCPPRPRSRARRRWWSGDGAWASEPHAARSWFAESVPARMPRPPCPRVRRSTPRPCWSSSAGARSLASSRSTARCTAARSTFRTGTRRWGCAR